MSHEPIRQEIQCLKYNEYPLGKRIKSSKMLYQWTFKYEGKIYHLKFYVSWVSCYRELLLNETVLLKKERYYGKLCLSFQFGYDSYFIEQVYGNFILRINTIPFKELIRVIPSNSLLVENDINANDDHDPKEKERHWNGIGFINELFYTKSKDEQVESLL